MALAKNLVTTLKNKIENQKEHIGRLMAKVRNIVSPLRCFKISSLTLFFRREADQHESFKCIQNIPPTERRN